MVDATAFASVFPAFVVVSGSVSFILLALAVKAYRRTRDSGMIFLAAAFAVFGVKNFLLGYVITYNLWGSADVGLVDAVADLTAILLFVVPVLFDRR